MMQCLSALKRVGDKDTANYNLKTLFAAGFNVLRRKLWQRQKILFVSDGI